MPFDKATWDKVKWRLIQNHLKHSKEELELLRSNPRNGGISRAATTGHAPDGGTSRAGGPRRTGFSRKGDEG